MKSSHIQTIVCLGMMLICVFQASAQDWSYYDTANVGDMYYDKSRIREVDKNIIAVWTKNVLSEKAKKRYFSILQDAGHAPKNPSVLSYYEELLAIDYAGRRIKNVAVIFYDQKGRIIYASPASETGDWNPIEPNSVGEKLSNLVSWEPAAPGKTAPPESQKTALAPKTDIAKAPADSKTTLPDPKPPRESTLIAKPEAVSTGTRMKKSENAENSKTDDRPGNPVFEDKKSRPAPESPAPVPATARVMGSDGRFIAFDNQTVLDTRTNLMWAARDNGRDTSWYGAKRYCAKYRGGGYTDWRMPTQDELAGLYDAGKTQPNEVDQNPLHLTTLIDLTACCPWAAETQGSQSAYFDFTDGTRWWFLTPGTSSTRVIPVRSFK